MRSFLLKILLSFVASAAPAMAAPLLDVLVHDLDSGRYKTVYPYRGQQYIVGQPGHRYTLSLRNNTAERLMAVVSIDGVNVITGETASTSQSGYVLDPWQQTEIKGWRKSLRQSAEFYFTSLPNSYAGRTGRPNNVGVIGVAVFRERAPPVVFHNQLNRDDAGPYEESEAADMAGAAAPATESMARPNAAAPAGRAKSAQAEKKLGTGHGQRRYDPVSYTDFERAQTSPNQVVSIYYDSYQTLVKRGIVPQRRARHVEPDPFPSDFVPDP